MGVVEVQLACSDDPIVVGIKKRAKFQFLSILEEKMVGNTLGRRVISHIHWQDTSLETLTLKIVREITKWPPFCLFFKIDHTV